MRLDIINKELLSTIIRVYRSNDIIEENDDPYGYVTFDLYIKVIIG